MSKAMGGACFTLSTVRQVMQCIEGCLGVPSRSGPNPAFPSVAHILGVHINVALHPEDNSPINMNSRLFIYANQSIPRHFPIPESYWTDEYVDSLKFVSENI